MRTFVAPGVRFLHEHHGLFFLPHLYLLALRSWRFLYCPHYCILYISMALRAYSDDNTTFATSSVFNRSSLVSGAGWPLGSR